MPTRLLLLVLSLVLTLTTLPPGQASTAVLRYGSLPALQARWSQAPQLASFPSACGIGATRIQAVDSGSRRLLLPLVANNAGSLSATNRAGPPARPQVAPDPALQATLTQDGAAPRDFAAAVEFLYTGTNPVQTGVQSGIIDRSRVAVVRGTVTGSDGTALSGVQVAIFDRPELGQTLTRADGSFDLAVNGGQQLTICLQREGFLPVQRDLVVPIRDYRRLDDVALLPIDPLVTAVDLNASQAVQAVRGSSVRDADGERQATLFFPQGTTVELLFADGSVRNISTLNVRASEYTVGEQGPAAMPGELPVASGYTYAVEFSVDEALTVGAIDVRFSQPVINYLENFLDFPVGTTVPAGSYNRTTGLWEPEPNGRVVEVLRIDDGFAVLDVDGSGQPASAAVLAELGISEAERAQVAALYQAGQSLWRTPVTHFTPWDCNWPYGPPPDARPREGPPPETDESEEDDCEEQGRSSIYCHSQALGEGVDIVGTPFRLHYRSDRMPGNTTRSSIRIPVSESGELPASLQGIQVEVQVAGRQFTRSFGPEPNQIFNYTWDGTDSYGRLVRGTQPARVRIGYVYPAVYYEPAEFQNAFGAFGDMPLSNNQARQEITSWQEWSGFISSEPLDPRASGLGGWTLNVHHTYDPVGLRMSLGDGSNRDLNDRSDGSLAVYAGSGRIRSGSGDGTGGPAIDASLGLSAMAIGPDNSLYLAESFNGALGTYNEIRRISPDGIISLYAGVSREVCRAEDLPCGDGGPATEAPLYFPSQPAFGPDGSLYFVDSVLRSPFGGYRIRRITPDGIIHTVGGNGQEIGQDPGRDGQPATDAALNGVNALAVGPDGSVYFNESQRYTMRRIAPDGTLSTIAGNGETCFNDCGEGIPARDARVGNIRGLAVDSENTIYFSEHNSIRRIRSDGIIETLATGSEQTFTNPERLHITSSNELLIIDGFRGVNLYPQIWTLAPNGTLRLITETSFYNVRDALIGSDGVLYIGERNQVFTSRSLRYRGFNSIELTIPNVDGSETYVFNGEGRHLRTLNSLTGAIRYRFTYDDTGRLSSITDGDGNVTTIERDGNGNPTAIVGPYGARTGLGVDANGYLNRITDPSGASYSAGYNGPGGLLTSFTTPLNQRSQMSYDSVGRLTSSTDAANQTWTLVRSDDFGNDVVTMTRPDSRTYVYRSEQSTNDDSTLINQFPDGSQAQLTRSASGSVDTAYRFGSSSSGLEGADPRWGTLAPIAAEFDLRSPGGISSQRSQSREVAMTDRSDPLSVIAITDTVRIDGRPSTSIYDAASRTQQVTSPAGRNASQTYDEQGRLLTYQLPGLAPETRSYDERGRLTRISFGSGNERSISLGYNAAGQLASITDALGRTWALTYDQAGRVTSVTRPDNQVTRYTFNAAGSLMSLTPPGRPAHSFAYSPVNLLQSVTLPDVGNGPATTTYTYNANRQRTGITRPDGSQISYAYDAGGQLTSVTTPDGTTTYTYSDGNLATATTPDGVLSYRYDGHLTTEASWSGIINGSVQYTYGNGMRLSQQRVNNATRLAFQYDADGLLTQAGDLEIAYAPDSVFVQSTSLNQVGTTLSYDQYGSLGLYRATNGSATLFETSYTRDAIGRISSLRETIDGQTSTYAYTYDQAGRLTGVQRNGTSIAGYSYDPHGNRLSATDSNGTGNASYDNQDQLLSYGPISFNYNAAGDLLSRTTSGQTTGYTYDPLGNLLNVNLPDGRAVSYLVDGENRRIGKQIDGVLVQGWLYQNGLLPIAELDGSNTVVSRFIYGADGGTPSYMIRGGQTFRIISDQLGSPRLVVNAASGEIAQRLDYDAFGQVLQDTNPGFQPFGFAGGLYDPDTSLVRFGSRDYDPVTGRWTTRDPALFEGGDSNAYAYVNNDPVNFSDPSGEVLPLLAGAAALIWAIVEAGLTVTDVFEFIEALFDPCVSNAELAALAALLLLGVIGPGGGYTKARKLFDNIADWLQRGDNVGDAAKKTPKLDAALRKAIEDVGGNPNQRPRVVYPPGGGRTKPHPRNEVGEIWDELNKK